MDKRLIAAVIVMSVLAGFLLSQAIQKNDRTSEYLAHALVETANQLRKRAQLLSGRLLPCLSDAGIAAGLMQEKLAEKAELNVRTVQKIEAGQTNILITTASRLQKALKCDWDHLCKLALT